MELSQAWHGLSELSHCPAGGLWAQARAPTHRSPLLSVHPSPTTLFLPPPPSIMSAHPSTSTSNSNFASIFNAALESYKRKTKKDLSSHPPVSGSFSDRGDSGSVIVDGLGRIGGLLTSGTGVTPSSDITYATPISFLLRRMHDNGLRKPNVNPVPIA